MLSRLFRKILINIRVLTNAFIREGSALSQVGPIKTFIIEGHIAYSITRDNTPVPSVRILKAVSLHCQECKCVFYLLIDSQTGNADRPKAQCPDCGSRRLTAVELLGRGADA